MLKQKSDNKDWLELFANCDKIVSKERLEELETKAIQAIRRIAKNDICTYGYSGGKDSVVIKHLIEKACVDIPCFCSITAYEYPVMERFIKQTAPYNTLFIKAKDHSVDFLNKNPEYLFPIVTDRKVRDKYTKHWRMEPQKELNKKGFKAMITGRRLEDGNSCGKKIDGIYTSENKLIRSYNIIADWSHAELLAYFKANELPLAPIYDFPNGFVFGTQMWIERDRIDNSISKTFDELWEIDQSIIINVAKEGLIEAQKYLKGRGL